MACMHACMAAGSRGGARRNRFTLAVPLSAKFAISRAGHCHLHEVLPQSKEIEPSDYPDAQKEWTARLMRLSRPCDSITTRLIKICFRSPYSQQDFNDAAILLSCLYTRTSLSSILYLALSVLGIMLSAFSDSHSHCSIPKLRQKQALQGAISFILPFPSSGLISIVSCPVLCLPGQPKLVRITQLQEADLFRCIRSSIRSILGRISL